MTASSTQQRIVLPLLAGAALLAPACADPTALEQVDLAVAMRRWDARGYQDYQLELGWLCGECPTHWNHHLRLTIRNGIITDVVDVTAGMAIGEDERTLTVQELFTYIQDAVDRHAHRVEAKYEPTLGYPTSLFVDWNQTTVDDEGGFAVTSLVLLP